MKKIISFLLILVMVLAAVGCESEVTEIREYPVKEENFSSDQPPFGSVSHPGKAVDGTGKEDLVSSAEKSSSWSVSGAGSSTGSTVTGTKFDESPAAGITSDESPAAGIASGASTETAKPATGIAAESKTEAAVINHDDSAPASVAEGEAAYGGLAMYDMEESKSAARDMESPLSSEIRIIDPVDPIFIEEPYEPYDPVPYQISSGLLTAGEWNDNKNFGFIQNLLANGQNYNYSDFFKKWGLSPFTRLVVKCTAAGAPAEGAHVSVTCATNSAIYEGVTDHDGICYVYYSVIDRDASPTHVAVSYGGDTQVADITPSELTGEQNVEIAFENRDQKTKKLDLMFTIDTTGSMSDEIRYLQKELENVIIRVKNDCGNIPVRLSVNFYRDHGDTYVVKPYEFTTDIDTALACLAREYADGGGDYEEAVELALESSICDHDWDEDSIKLMFMVLDAPPHNTSSIRESLHESIMAASKKGIRIIPVASSGVDKDTEFLLRAFAMTTGGTYTFLTDDSGIGGSHLEPTVGDYEVEHLNDMLVRIIEEYIG